MRMTLALASIGCAASAKLIQLGPGDYPGAFVDGEDMVQLQVNFLGTDTAPVANDELPMVAFDHHDETRYKGNISLSLDDDTSLKLVMSAGAGKKFAIRDMSGEGDGTWEVRFEFQASVACGDDSPFMHQEIRGTTFVPVFEYVHGSPAMPAYDAAKSFLELGRCDGCAACEIFSRVTFTGTAADAFNGIEFTSVSWTASYDNTNVLAGLQQYYVGTDNYLWMRKTLLVEHVLPPALTPASPALTPASPASPASPPPSPPASDGDSGLGSGANAGIAIGATVGAVGLLALGFVVAWKTFKSKEGAKNETPTVEVSAGKV